MKPRLQAYLTILASTLFLASGTQQATAAQLPADPSNQAQEGVQMPGQDLDSQAAITVTFDQNGGKGTMGSLKLQPGEEASLPANTFTKAGFTFTGWSTDRNGKGTLYKDKDDVSALLEEAGDTEAVTLYAQWALKKPVIKSVKSPSPDLVKVSYQKHSGAKGHEIQYSTNKSFQKAKSIEAGGNTKSIKLWDITPGKKYYIRMRSYAYNGSTKSYSGWSKTMTVKIKNGSTIVNTKSYMAISADVKLSGSGGGYHAKLVMATPTSAVSYGIQYDGYAQAPYTGKAMALIENVSTNAAGGQRYTRPGDKSLTLGKTYNLMLAIDQKGNGSVYLDYQKIGSFSQPNLANGQCYLRIEASARRNGDSVDASFSNIKCKWNGEFDPSKVSGEGLSWVEFKQNAGLSYTKKKDGSIRLHGKIRGIAGDWDSDYNSVSEILQFQ